MKLAGHKRGCACISCKPPSKAKRAEYAKRAAKTRAAKRARFERDYDGGEMLGRRGGEVPSPEQVVRYRGRVAAREADYKKADHARYAKEFVADAGAHLRRGDVERARAALDAALGFGLEDSAVRANWAFLHRQVSIEEAIRRGRR